MGLLGSIAGILSMGGLDNHNVNQKIKQMDDDPNCTTKTDRWYREHNTTPEEQEKLRLRESMIYRKEHGMTYYLNDDDYRLK
ncbi:MAG: hypothetical protein K0S18_127 [Anaerocolumna sp.]|jgi:hypothetical protein|nr:hypothetical protein [Anaerocolumna sp.]